MNPSRVIPIVTTALFALLCSCSKSEETVLKEFKDVNTPMEEETYSDEGTGYYNFFRVQNASDHTVYFNISTKYGSEPDVIYIRPGQQGTTLVVLEKIGLTGLTDALITDLSLMGWITFWVNAPAPGRFPPLGGGRPGEQRWLAEDLDTMARYSFYDGLEYDSRTATPKDPARWTFEQFSDHRVRWTYRITNEDRDEAVRQTLERWAKKDDEESEQL
ncbi:MAG: hypothetical protein K2O63_04425 [Alistipes sp.]|nr:hypothetical protein [Alistipes sp.]